MAWQLGPYSLNQGSSMRIAFWWDNDPGVQAIQAYPVVIPPPGAGTYVATTSAVEITNIQVENEPGRGNIRPGNNQLTYFVTVAARRKFSNASLPAIPMTFYIRGGKV